jgi:hypothetical protein
VVPARRQLGHRGREDRHWFVFVAVLLDDKGGPLHPTPPTKLGRVPPSVFCWRAMCGRGWLCARVCLVSARQKSGSSSSSSSGQSGSSAHMRRSGLPSHATAKAPPSTRTSGECAFDAIELQMPKIHLEAIPLRLVGGVASGCVSLPTAAPFNTYKPKSDEIDSR